MMWLMPKRIILRYKFGANELQTKTEKERERGRTREREKHIVIISMIIKQTIKIVVTSVVLSVK